jgi:outer membrane protein TolC
LNLTEPLSLKLNSRTRCTLLLATLVGTVLPASAQVSLSSVVLLAQRNSSAIRLAQADVDKAAASLAETRGIMIPSLQIGSGLPVFPSVGFTGSPASIWSASVQSLVFGIPQKHFIDSAKLGRKAAVLNLKEASEQVALDASLAYIELDTVQTELATTQQQEEHTARLIEIEQQRAEAGVDPASAVIEAKLTAAEIRLKRVQLEARAQTLAAQLEALTGLSKEAIQVDHKSIPEVPSIRGTASANPLPGVEAARMQARAKNMQAKGDNETHYWPQFNFGAQYNRNTTLLNNANNYYARRLPANNFSSGINVQIPLFDMAHLAKMHASSAEALRAKTEAEQAEQQNDLQVATLSGTIRQLDAYAEVTSLKQQLATEQLQTVLAQMEFGNGASSTPQITPKAEQLARIEERQKALDALEANFNLTKARLGLLRALGHITDWLDELKTK